MNPDMNEHIKKKGEKLVRSMLYFRYTRIQSHAPTGVLKNAIDSLYAEWNNKAAES
jgi:NAD(P)H-dependent FMN reductase